MPEVTKRPPGEDRIHLRLGLNEDGYPYLYDAATGRPVAFQREIKMAVHDVHDDVLIARFEVIIDPRMLDGYGAYASGDVMSVDEYKAMKRRIEEAHE